MKNLENINFESDDIFMIDEILDTLELSNRNDVDAVVETIKQLEFEIEDLTDNRVEFEDLTDEEVEEVLNDLDNMVQVARKELKNLLK